MSDTSAEPIRVLHLLRWVHYRGGGIRTFLLNLVSALDGAPVAISAASLEPSRPPAYLPNVPYVGRPGAGRLRKMFEFWTWVRCAVGGADVVHIHNLLGAPFVLGATACRLAGTPYVVSPHGALEPELLGRKRWRKWLFLKLIVLPLLRRSAVVLATTPQNERSIRALDSRLPVALVVPGVDAGVGEIAERESAARQPNGLTVVYLGRFDAGKGLAILMDALGVLRDRGCQVSLKLAGEGPEESQVRAQARTLALEERVGFMGYLDGPDKWRALRSADVVAVPSPSENFSYVAAEALSTGVPVVVTTGAGIAELVVRGDCGSVVPPNDVKALADALAEYLDPAVRAERGARALEFAGMELSLKAMGRRILAIYRATAARRAA